MNDAIEKALKTWYPIDQPLHLDPRHPAIKLAGEAGEILDLYGKHEYKPGFDWWQCKNCFDTECRCDNETLFYTPLIINELGDLWYYLRILYYITGKSPELVHEHYLGNIEIGQVLAVMNNATAQAAYDILINKHLDTGRLHVVYSCLNDLSHKLEIFIDQLTESNYRKLNSDPTNHGWKNA